MYINGKDIYLISCNTIKQKSTINKNIDDDMIQTVIKTAQDIYLRQIIGEDLLSKLCTLVESNTLSGAYKTLVDEYIRDYMVYRVTADIQVPLYTKIRAEGVVNQSGTNFASLALSDLTYTKEYYENLSNSFVNTLCEYLRKNEASFPEYKRYKTANIKYNTHIYLG